MRRGPTCCRRARRPTRCFLTTSPRNFRPGGRAGRRGAVRGGDGLEPQLHVDAFLRDIYQRYLRPRATEREAMRVLYGSTLLFGLICTVAALAMIEIKSALDVWWELAGIFGGGMLGLFLLGRWRASTMLSPPRALVEGRQPVGRGPAMAAVAAGVGVILWMTWSPYWPEAYAAFRSPFHNQLVIVIGTLTILGVGVLLGARPTGLEHGAHGGARSTRGQKGGFR